MNFTLIFPHFIIEISKCVGFSEKLRFIVLSFWSFLIVARNFQWSSSEGKVSFEWKNIRILHKITWKCWWHLTYKISLSQNRSKNVVIKEHVNNEIYSMTHDNNGKVTSEASVSGEWLIVIRIHILGILDELSAIHHSGFLFSKEHHTILIRVFRQICGMIEFLENMTKNILMHDKQIKCQFTLTFRIFLV